MRAFAYRRAERLAEGFAPGSRPLGGGTDLLPLLKERLLAPDTLIDLTQIADAGARQIEAAPEGALRLGGGVTLAELARDGRVRRDYAALAEAAEGSATPQIRNVATLAGNLCQWNRCWYFRSGVKCHLSGGDSCPAAGGDNRHHAIYPDGPCVAVHPSDPAVALVALGATVLLEGPAGPREARLEAFLHAPRGQSPEQAELRPGELVAGVRLDPPGGRRSAYEKAMDRQAWAFALVSAAAVLQVRHGVVTGAEIALGGVAGAPHPARAAAESLVGQPLSADAARRAADLAADGARPLAWNGYKLELARGVVRAALSRLLPDGPG